MGTHGARAWHGAVLIVIAAAIVLAVSAARASTVGWSQIQAMPPDTLPVTPLEAQNGFGVDTRGEVVTSPTGAAFLYYQDGETPMVAQFNADGTLGTPQAIPGAGDQVIGLHEVHFLPDGDAIFSWELQSGQGYGFADRLADGTWGAPIEAENPVGWGVRSGELLTVGDSGSDLDAVSYTINPDGSFSAPSAPQQIYSGLALGVATVAMDPGDAVASVVFTDRDTDALEEVNRDATGSWIPTPQTIAAAGSGISAVAPDGRALLAWTSTSGSDELLNWDVREPGGVFTTSGSASYANASPYLANFLDVAAGPDGTLALAYTLNVCPSDGNATGSAVEYMVLGPDADTGTPGAVPGSEWTLTGSGGGMSSMLESLGAGDGRAIVGFDTNDSPQNVSCGASDEGESTYTDDSDVSILGGDGAPGLTQLDSFTQQAPVNYPRPGAAGLDIAGNAAVTGGFTQAAVGYATFGTPGSAAGAGTSSTTTTVTTTATTPTTPTPPVTPPTATTGTTTTTTTFSPPPTRPTIIITTVVSSNGEQTITVTNPNAYQTQFQAQLYVSAPGLLTTAVDAARSKKAKAKLVLIGKAAAKAGAHQKVVLKLKLSRAALKALHHRHKLKATLKLTESAAGHPSTVVTRPETLKP
jgi:hypothetical protein